MSRRRATLGLCPACHTPTLRGLDNDLLALDALADITPITREAETAAHANNLATYTISNGELHHRDPHTSSRPIGTLLRQHACDQPIPADHAAPARPRATEVNW